MLNKTLFSYYASRYLGYKMPKRKKKKKHGSDAPKNSEPLHMQHIRIEMEPVQDHPVKVSL